MQFHSSSPWSCSSEEETGSNCIQICLTIMSFHSCMATTSWLLGSLSLDKDTSKGAESVHCQWSVSHRRGTSSPHPSWYVVAYMERLAQEVVLFWAKTPVYSAYQRIEKGVPMRKNSQVLGPQNWAQLESCLWVWPRWVLSLLSYVDFTWQVAAALSVSDDYTQSTWHDKGHGLSA